MVYKPLVLILAGALLLPAADTGADAAWARLKSLAGEWEGEAGGVKGGITYTVVSGGHAVLESMKMPAPQPDMVTIYHRDGAGLVATHYCSMGNQPRMRAAGADANGKTIRFRFADITNLAKPGAAHIRHLTVTFQDADHFTQSWTAFSDGKESTEVFKCSRKKK
ncbi:MAG: hypothetical protein ACM336_13840 [Acidobacteriota bacterium]